MSRTYKLWRSWLLLLPVGVVVGCSHGGPLDPLDNVGGNVMPPPPGTTIELPACSATVGAPCKIAFSDLGFVEDPSCMHKGDTTLGMTWNGTKDRLQFGVSESSTLQACPSYEHKQCDVTLSAVPELFKTLQAGKIRLTFSEKHRFFLYVSTAGSTINGTGVATGTLRFGSRDALTLTGMRTNQGAAELLPVSATLTPGSDRTVGFRVSTDCGQVFAPNLPIYWSIEGMTAEMLP